VKKTGIIIGLVLLVGLGYGYFGRVAPKSVVPQGDISQEDLEVIENLDFLDDLELLKEDLNRLEDYESIPQTEATGDSYE
jgi:hypothetical protein